MAEYSGTKTEQGGLLLGGRVPNTEWDACVIDSLVVFLRDGRLVGRLEEPTPDLVLDSITAPEA